jgi:membrane-associated protease RseP (regulator of RpoE activity)
MSQHRDAIPQEYMEKARALRNAVLWESNASIEHIARALMAESAAPSPSPAPGVVEQMLADLEANLDDAISYLVDLAGAKPSPMSPMNCRIYLDHARMEARRLAELTAAIGAGQQAVAIKGGPDEVEWIKFVDRGTKLYTHPAPSGQAVTVAVAVKALEEIEADIKELDALPPSIQSQRNIRIINAFNRTRSALSNPPAQPGWRMV